VVHRKILVITCFCTLLLLTIKSGSACHICDPVCCWQSPSECLNPPEGWCVGVRNNFCIDLGGCVVAFSDTHTCYGGLFKPSCSESASVTDWHALGGFGWPDGYNCKVKWGIICAGEYNGKWDRSEGKCVGCSGNIENNIYYCSGDFGYSSTGDSRCESACGASSQCDEQNPSTTLSDECWTLYKNYLETSRICDSNCIYHSTKYYCSSSNCGDYKICGGSGYYCVYDSGWYWRTSKPTNFCCSDADCTAYKCDTNIYRCKDLCISDADCKSGYSCYCGVCSSTFTSAGCAAGKCCNRGYGGAGIGRCVDAGSITSDKKYLCDPPEWESNEPNQKNLSNNTIFDLIFNFFSHFFQR